MKNTIVNRYAYFDNLKHEDILLKGYWLVYTTLHAKPELFECDGIMHVLPSMVGKSMYYCTLLSYDKKQPRQYRLYRHEMKNYWYAFNSHLNNASFIVQKIMPVIEPLRQINIL